MLNPLANFIGVFSLVRDDQGFQVNPLCRHNITRSDRQTDREPVLPGSRFSHTIDLFLKCSSGKTYRALGCVFSGLLL